MAARSTGILAHRHDNLADSRRTAHQGGCSDVSNAAGHFKQQGYEELVKFFGDKTDLYTALFLGTRGGSAGETSALLLLLGGAYLIYKGYINWQVPVGMIGTVGALTWMFGGHAGLFSGDPLLHMLSGGLILGAFSWLPIW